MRRTLVVHIGTPKTGSTSIQDMLHRLAIPLQKLGIHIPSSGRSGNFSHGGLAFVYPGSPLYGRSHRAWAALRDELCHHPAPRFVISAETFSTGAADHVADRVSDLAETVGLDVEVVAYVRPQYQRLEAGYAEDIRIGFHAAEFRTVLEQLPDWPGLDYPMVFRPWRDKFGDGLKVHPLEPCRMPKGLLAHFLGLIGARDLVPVVSLLLPPLLPRRNVRVGARLVEVLRLASAALDERMIDIPRKRAMLKPLLCTIPPLLNGDLPFAGLSPAQVQEVTDRFAACNARFARDYGIDKGGVLFRDTEGDGLTRPTRVTWDEDFSEEERARVRGAVRSAVGVHLPPGAAAAGRRRACSVWRRAMQWRQTRSTSVRGNEWRRLALTEPREFTPLWPVSIVVFCATTPDALGRTVAALERQTYPHDLIEVVIVDATSPSPWAQPASVFPTVRRIRCPDGEAAARNAGVRAATHDILLFLDVGLTPEPGWLAGHAQWHHRVSDVVTVESPVVSGTGPAPPHDWARAMSGPFGIGRWFFELVGEFDAALAPRERQDVEFGWRARTCGGLLAPAGAAAAAGLPNSARTVLPAPVAGSGGPAAGQSGTVPRWSVAIEVNPGGGRAAVEAVERLRAEAGVSVAILVDVDEATADTEWLRERLGEDVRLRWGPVADACHIHRAVPLHVRAPARNVGIGDLLARLEVELGDAVAGTATLADGTRLSVARAWALHRARRTGCDMSEFGRVVTIGARRLQAGVYPVLMDFWQTVSVIGRCGRWIAGGIHADRRDNPLRRSLGELRDLADRVARRIRRRFA